MKADLRGTLIAAILYATINAAIRLVGGTRLAMDDAKTNLFTQVWRWGYQADNPPLYEWLIKSLHVVTGGGLASFLVLNAVCLIASAVFTHLAVRRIAGERTACGAACGLVLLYQIGWNYHQAFTHSALLTAMVCAGMWAGVRLVQDRSSSSYAVLGIVFGLGLLSKYNFALFAGGFVIAALTSGQGRRAVLDPRFAGALALAALIVVPQGLWLAGRADLYAGTLPETLGTDGAWTGRVGNGLLALVVAVLSFFLPWAFVYGWLRRRPVPPPAGGPRSMIARGVHGGLVGALPLRRRTTPLAARRRSPRERGDSPASDILARTSIVSLAALTLAIVAFGIGALSERYVIPVLLPGYAAATTALLNARPAALRPYLLASLVVALSFSGIRLAGFVRPGPPFCEDCRAFVPYEALTDTLAATVPADAILLAREENTAGNLVAAFPDARVTSLNLLTQFNPATPADAVRPCYYVWSEDMVSGVPLHPVFSFAYDDPRTVPVDGAWPRRLGQQGRRTRWGITPLEGPLYARFCALDAPG